MYAIQGHEKIICSFVGLKSRVVQAEDWRSESHCRQGTTDLEVLLLEGELSKHPLCSHMTVGLRETVALLLSVLPRDAIRTFLPFPHLNPQHR